MPFIRYTRDKRGYETTCVMHAYRSGSSGSSATRVLYLFRSPAHIKMGRRALDEESREALTHTHPDLTFDWMALNRSLSAPRVEPSYEQRPRRHDSRHAQPAPQPKPVPPPIVVVDDESLLGRTLGALEAARLRQRYQDLLQRIARRARTPEDRDRLIDRAQRLNPDDWADETVVRATCVTVEAEWDALVAELPARRRGRRGGRNRQRGRGGAAEPSIIGGNGEIDAPSEEEDADAPDDRGDERSARSDSDALGPGPGPTGDGIPGDD